jgi:hypothetical protein
MADTLFETLKRKVFEQKSYGACEDCGISFKNATDKSRHNQDEKCTFCLWCFSSGCNPGEAKMRPQKRSRSASLPAVMDMQYDNSPSPRSPGLVLGGSPLPRSCSPASPHSTERRAEAKSAAAADILEDLLQSCAVSLIRFVRTCQNWELCSKTTTPLRPSAASPRFSCFYCFVAQILCLEKSSSWPCLCCVTRSFVWMKCLPTFASLTTSKPSFRWSNQVGLLFVSV